jgi:hypothetical protein
VGNFAIGPLKMQGLIRGPEDIACFEDALESGVHRGTALENFFSEVLERGAAKFGSASRPEQLCRDWL